MLKVTFYKWDNFVIFRAECLTHSRWQGMVAIIIEHRTSINPHQLAYRKTSIFMRIVAISWSISRAVFQIETNLPDHVEEINTLISLGSSDPLTHLLLKPKVVFNLSWTKFFFCKVEMRMYLCHSPVKVTWDHRGSSAGLIASTRQSFRCAGVPWEWPLFQPNFSKLQYKCLNGQSLVRENEKLGKLLWWTLAWPTLPADGVGSREIIGQVKPKVKGIYGHLARDHLRRRKYYNGDMSTEFQGNSTKKRPWPGII